MPAPSPTGRSSRRPLASRTSARSSTNDQPDNRAPGEGGEGHTHPPPHRRRCRVADGAAGPARGPAGLVRVGDSRDRDGAARPEHGQRDAEGVEPAEGRDARARRGERGQDPQGDRETPPGGDVTTLNLDKLKLAVGDLIERGNASSAHGDLRRYADDPLGFCRDVLDVDPWSKQEEIALAVRDHPQVHVRGANNLGKDAVAGWLALWWAYAREGLVLLTSASERQVREILMRREIGGAFRRAQLPGELLTTGLRVGEETRMLAFTSDDSSRYTGFHHPRVLALVSEAQGVDEAALEGLYTSAGGEQDRLVVYGNPVSPTGWFYRTSRPHTAWHKIQVSAFDLLGSGRRIP